MPKSSSRRRRDKQQAAAEEVASLREKVATLEQQALARQPLRHGTPAARTPASRPSTPRAEPPPQEPAPQEDGEEPEEGDQQQQSELDGDSNRNDGEAGDSDASTPSDHSDGDQDDPDGAVQSGLAGDVLAGVQEQLESGSADNSRSMPPDVASTLAGILQKHSDADTVPPAWALNMLLPAPTSQLCSAVASNSADIQGLAAEIKRLRTARNPKATPQTPSGGRKASTKRGPPQSSTGSDGQRKSSKTVEQRHCDYPKCNSRDSHNTDHCNLKKRDEKDGYERVRK